VRIIGDLARGAELTQLAVGFGVRLEDTERAETKDGVQHGSLVVAQSAELEVGHRSTMPRRQHGARTLGDNGFCAEGVGFEPTMRLPP